MHVVTRRGGKPVDETFRVTKVVGGRYREDFVGVVEGGERGGDRGERGDEHVLPATYVFSTRSWRYKGYSVMVKERPAMATRGRWSRECLPLPQHAAARDHAVRRPRSEACRRTRASCRIA